MDLMEKYKEYREIQVSLHTNILNKFVSKDDFKKSAEIMGIVQ